MDGWMNGWLDGQKGRWIDKLIKVIGLERRKFTHHRWLKFSKCLLTFIGQRLFQEGEDRLARPSGT